MAAASDQTLGPQWDRFRWRALVVGAVLLILCLASALVSDVMAVQFYRSYLLAYLFWVGIALGCLAIVMLQHLTGGAWGVVIRRVLEAGTRTLPWLAVLFTPLAFGLQDLYVWARWPLSEPQSLYLNIPFFLIRVVVYFAVWLALAYFLNRWSLEQDRTADPDLPRRFRSLSAPGLGLFGLTVTFASIDWAMSLEPYWSSTTYGALFAMGLILAAFAFTIIVVIALASRPPLSEVLAPAHLNDLGNMLLMFVMVWAYLAFSQFLLIWAGNLPEEIPWYVRRLQGGWQWLGLASIVLQFALPFLLLLSRDIKRHGRTLTAVAGLVLAMRFLDLFWLLAPSFDPSGFSLHWMDVAAPLGLGGIWIALFLGQLRKCSVLPIGDPWLAEAAHHRD